MSDRISHERPQRQAGRNENGLSCSVVARSTKDPSDGFLRHAVIGGNLAQGFVVFHDTAYQRSAMLPVGCLSSARVDPKTVGRGGEVEYCQAVVPVQVVFGGVYREE